MDKKDIRIFQGLLAAIVIMLAVNTWVLADRLSDIRWWLGGVGSDVANAINNK